MAVHQQPATPFTLGTHLSEPTGAHASAYGTITRRTTGEPLGRTGTIHTPHGDIHTPAFIPVGTRATVKTLTPEQIRSTGAQAVLGNAYHLYLQPGADIVDEAGGIAEFMNWHGPTYTDSGGFQVLSLGSGFKKVLAAEFAGTDRDGEVRRGKERMANVDDEGVTFRSHLDGSRHRFTPEVSMQIQHQLGADIIFAFDELTTLLNSRGYQEEALERTRLWAERCLVEHSRLTVERAHRPPQALWGVIQGAQYEDLRRKACRRSRAVLASVASALGAPCRRKTWVRSWAGVTRNYPRISHVTCWEFRSRTIFSLRWKMVRTRSTVWPRAVWAATAVFTPRMAV